MSKREGRHLSSLLVEVRGVEPQFQALPQKWPLRLRYNPLGDVVRDTSQHKAVPAQLLEREPHPLECPKPLLAVGQRRRHQLVVPQLLEHMPHDEVEGLSRGSGIPQFVAVDAHHELHFPHSHVRLLQPVDADVVSRPVDQGEHEAGPEREGLLDETLLPELLEGLEEVRLQQGLAKTGSANQILVEASVVLLRVEGLEADIPALKCDLSW